MKLLNLKNQSNLVLYVDKVDFIKEQDSPWCSEQLFDLWQKIHSLPKESLDISVDFQYCNFLTADGVAFLGGLFYQIKARGGQIDFRWDTLPEPVRINLAQNGFLSSFDHYQGPWDGNSIPYRTDQCHSNEIANYLRDKWLGKGWVNVSPNLRNCIVGQVLEIYLNAFEHSQSEIGVFSCGQHYPESRILQLTVVDFGQGIPMTVRSAPQNLSLSSEEALNWAFKPGTSTRKDSTTGGMGLNLLQEFVTRNHGSLMIFSNDRQLIIDDNGIRNKNRRIDFSGTLVNIQLRCDESYYDLEVHPTSSQRSWF